MCKVAAAKMMHIAWWLLLGTGLILGLHPANERRRYKVIASLIGCLKT